MGVMAAMLGERLGVPQATLASEVSLDGSTLRVQRQAGTDRAVVSAELPALISVLEKINEPRYPSFKGIMAAKTKPTATWSLADLGIEPSSVGLAGATTEVINSAEREGRADRTIIKDDGDAGTRIADFLVARKLL